MKETERFLKVIRDLRQNCPWDKKQTHQSLRPYLLEEAYEAADAIDRKDIKDLKEELGDILLQVALHAEMASEKKAFDFEQVAKSIADKMIRRHPHVYAGAEVDGIEGVRTNWAKIKEKEKPDRKVLEGIPRALPSLQRAQRIGQRVGELGFDWPNAKEAFKKVEEELSELKKEVNRRQVKQKAVEEELGDLIFALGNLSRHLGLEMEGVAQKACDKFITRFNRVESSLKKKRKKVSDASFEELEKEWQRAKRPA